MFLADIDLYAYRAYRVGIIGRTGQVRFRGLGTRLRQLTGDRFCDAMIAIRKEAEDIILGMQPKDNNVLSNAPHPISVIAVSDADWNR